MAASPTIVLLGTLDTKGEEYSFLRDRITAAGVATLLVDVGTRAAPQVPPDITREEVAAEGGVDLRRLALSGDRGEAVAAMGAAAGLVLTRLVAEGRCDGVLAAGGSGNTTIAAAAMHALPVGLPKLVVSTVASGDTRAYVGTSDITLMASVVDVAGVNRLSARILGNAAAAMVGMVSTDPPPAANDRPLVAATMFGVTTPCVTVARRELEALGYEVLVFHANGTGGRALERMLGSGLLDGVLDVTTTELADELAGGALSAGPDRLEAAGRAGIPQVVSVGALDMVNFGPRDEVPDRYLGRLLHAHNPNVTLMRTTAAECVALAEVLLRKLATARGPAQLYLPLAGISQLDAPGEVFYDPPADAALFDTLRAGIAPPVTLREMPCHINDPAFGVAIAKALDAAIAGRPPAVAPGNGAT